MRAAVVPRPGPPEVIEIRSDWPEPDPPGPGEVMIAVEAAGLNPSDTKIRAVAADRSPRGLPYVAGREAAGTISGVGPDVEEFSVGDPVFCFFGWDAKPGGHCERLVVAAQAVALRPSRVPIAEAAGLPLAGLTAEQGMEFLDPPSGERVLVTAGAGGVGHYGVQLAAVRGAEVVATASTPNHPFLRELGASETVDYHNDDWVEHLRGIRYVLDCVGANNIALYASVLGNGARVAAIAGLPRDLRPDIQSTGIRCQANGERLTRLSQLMHDGKLSSTIHETFDLERAADAHRLLETRHVRGKLVIRIA